MIWEYLTYTYETTFESETMEEVLNRLGDAGWELVSCSYPSRGALLIFKRLKVS